MNELEKQHRLLKIMYDVDCPICSARSYFTITSAKTYLHHRRCGHNELDQILHQRWISLFQEGVNPDTGEIL